MNTKITNIVTLILALCASVLTFADTQLPLDKISPWLADKWPLVLCAMFLIRNLARVVGDWADDGTINGSFKMLIGALCIGSLSGCLVTGGFEYVDAKTGARANVGFTQDIKLPKPKGLSKDELLPLPTGGLAK